MRLLVNSSVIIAAFVQEHIHNVASERLLNLESVSLVTASHSLSEAYKQLTRPERVFVTLQPTTVASLLKALCDETYLRALTAQETQAAILGFATLNGRGARVYDYLIGYAAVLENVDALATWNVEHFLPLFPGLRVATPEQLLES